MILTISFDSNRGLIMSDSNTAHFTVVQDRGFVQAVLVSAAVDGNSEARELLPSILTALAPPYLQVAQELFDLLNNGSFVDRPVVRAALESRAIWRRTSTGQRESLSPDQVMGLLPPCTPEPGQLQAYARLLNEELARQRRHEHSAAIREAALRHQDSPDSLTAELQRLAAQYRSAEDTNVDQLRCERRELIPFIGELESRQRGGTIVGLDSGFEHLNYLTNGLDTGLFVIAAKPGEGKTTLVWQVCNQVAEREGVPVLFVSFEQSKRELRVKALSRLSRIDYRRILRGNLRADDDRWPQVLRAATHYSRYAEHLTILEGSEHTTISQICEHAERLKRATNASRILVAVDYLQIIPLDDSDGQRVTCTKDRIDLHVSGLRRMARDLNSPVIAISSENRAGYNKGRSMDVFKESGIIEYAADVAAVLKGPNGDQAGPEVGAEGLEYRLENLNIVKNRNGETGVVGFHFYPQRAQFVETGRRQLDPE